MTGAKEPFDLQVGYDQDELLGGRWWQQGLAGTYATGIPTVTSRIGPTRIDESRRSALKMLLGLGGFVVVAGLVTTRCSSSGSHTTTIDQASLDLQRSRGLATGAENVAFEWPHAVDTAADGTPLSALELHRLAAELRPSRNLEEPDYGPTLFQCLQETGGAAFSRQLRLVCSPQMRAAYGRGEAIRELLELAEERRAWALVVDLPGPDSVAFAAGLQPRAVAVFQFHNWPHPRGVVPAHLTLAAAAYYRHRFGLAPDAEQRAVCYVLDRDRLAPYANQPDRFDNRYVVRLPTAASLQNRGIRRVLYVVPEGQPADALDDVAERLAEYAAAGIGVRMLGLGDLTLAPADKVPGTASSSYTGSRYYWHGGPGHHYWFWHHHDWPSRQAPVTPTRPPTSSFGADWSPTRARPRQDLAQVGRTAEPRTTSSGSSSSGGSWGRSSGGFGG
ncbi:MAG: hypothetical protein JNK15_09145 [Planctomycetes bacterium]|nr:hypothetical protein [Planctomycetota bacterium]